MTLWDNHKYLLAFSRAPHAKGVVIYQSDGKREEILVELDIPTRDFMSIGHLSFDKKGENLYIESIEIGLTKGLWV